MSKSSRSTVIDVDVSIEARTEKAVLAHTGNKEEASWLPLSQIEINPTGFEGISTITLPEWLAQEKGLI